MISVAWIELHTVLIRHRKVKALARSLGIKPVEVVGYLATFWGNVLELAEDGDITKWSIEDEAEYSGWEGNPKKFHEAMLNNGEGFIDEIDGKKIVHDWWEYAGRYLKSKYHSYDPEKLAYIMSLYPKATFRQPKVNLKATNQPNQPTYHIVDDLKVTFYTAYKQKTTQEYIKDRIKDGAIIKSLLKDISQNELKELIVKFFNSDDPFVKNSGYTMGVFKSQINKLRLSKKPLDKWGYI